MPTLTSTCNSRHRTHLQSERQKGPKPPITEEDMTCTDLIAPQDSATSTSTSLEDAEGQSSFQAPLHSTLQQQQSASRSRHINAAPIPSGEHKVDARNQRELSDELFKLAELDLGLLFAVSLLESHYRKSKWGAEQNQITPGTGNHYNLTGGYSGEFWHERESLSGLAYLIGLKRAVKILQRAAVDGQGDSYTMIGERDHEN
jgi:hypothetical protein